MNKHLGWAAAAVVALGALSGCGDSTDSADNPDGGNSAEDYCAELKSAKDAFASFDGGDPTKFSDAIQQLRDLGGQAPEEISDDWQTMVQAMDGLEAAVEEAGLSFEDLATLGEGALPEGVTPADITKLQADVKALDDPKIEEAGNNISDHAKSECGVDIKGSGSSN
jgi:hypothetical protein